MEISDPSSLQPSNSQNWVQRLFVKDTQNLCTRFLINFLYLFLCIYYTLKPFSKSKLNLIMTQTYKHKHTYLATPTACYHTHWWCQCHTSMVSVCGTIHLCHCLRHLWYQCTWCPHISVSVWVFECLWHLWYQHKVFMLIINLCKIILNVDKAKKKFE